MKSTVEFLQYNIEGRMTALSRLAAQAAPQAVEQVLVHSLPQDPEQLVPEHLALQSLAQDPPQVPMQTPVHLLPQLLPQPPAH